MPSSYFSLQESLKAPHAVIKEKHAKHCQQNAKTLPYQPVNATLQELSRPACGKADQHLRSDKQEP